jgi:hypothetical protein
MAFAALVLQQIGAHHRRGGQRDDHRDKNGGREGHGKFAEQASDDASHQQQRDKDGDQRDADGEHGKTDFAGALQRRGEWRHAVFHVAHDIFHHDDGVVDDETRRNGHGHQRQVVEAVSEQVHHAERAEQ